MSASVLRGCAFVLLLLVALSGCGGGGGDGGGSLSPSATPFTLADPAFAKVGGSRTFNLSGSSNYGDKLTGVWSIARRADTTFNGQPARQFDQQLSITLLKNGGTEVTSETSYQDHSGRFLGSVDSDSVEGFPDGTQTPYPVTAVIGDFGVLGDISYSDGSSETINWRLDPHPGSSTLADLTEFISSVSPTDPDSDADMQLTRTIDSSGHVTGVKLSLFFKNGLTIDLSS